jgi:8-oxo-dGTP diphosphatase
MRTTARVVCIKDDSLLIMKRNKFGQEYYSLIGGAVDIGETTEQALFREVTEESGIVIQNPRLIIIEDAGDMYGIQYIYLSDYVSGEPVLASNSIEAQIGAAGQNTYQPMWLPLSDLPAINLLPRELKELLVTMVRDGFPSQPIALSVQD